MSLSFLGKIKMNLRKSSGKNVRSENRKKKQKPETQKMINKKYTSKKGKVWLPNTKAFFV